MRREATQAQSLYLARVNSVHELVRSTVNLITYPNPPSAMDYIIANVARARNVMDTRVFFSTAEDETEISRHRKERALRFDESRKQALRSGAVWRDIYSQNRLPDVKAHLDWKRSQDEELAYALRELHVDYPIVNFIIVDYEGGASDLLFGWGNHRFDMHGSVFFSRDPNMIQYFRRYFELLWNLGTAV